MKSFRNLLQSLNTYQREAVENFEGPSMVVAGAGTGKTAVLSMRIMNMLLSESQIQPNMILCLTYTDAGVIAMKRRLTEYMGAEAYKIPIHTFHSLCNEIVQTNMDYFRLRELEPASDVEVLQVIRKIIRELPADNTLYRAKGDQYYEVDRLKNLFRMMKEEYWDENFIATRCREYIDSLPDNEDFKYKRANAKEGIQVGDPKKKEIQKVTDQMVQLWEAAHLLAVYNHELQKIGRYDFNDMITWVIDAFKDSEWMKLSYQEKYQYVLVDEMQDTNGSQIQLLKLLLDFYQTPNLLTVGDARQAIYEFAGARIANIADISQTYAGTEYCLNENYRSTQNILDAATKVISNSVQLEGDHDLISRSKSVEQGEWPIVVEYPNEFTEQAHVVDQVVYRLKEGIPAHEIAVIFRKHRQGELIMKELSSRGIALNVKRRINVLEIPLIRNLITLVRAMDPAYTDYLIEDISRFGFCGIDQHRYQNYILIKKSGQRSRLPKDMVAMKETLNNSITKFANEPFILCMESLLYDFKIIAWIQTQENHLQLMEIIHTFYSFLKEEIRKNPLHTVKTILEVIDIMVEEGVAIPVQNLASSEEGVNMLTCHGAKGLEFQAVLMVGCTSNEWETSRSPSNTYPLPPTLYVTPEDKVESNRRLFYVAMTRAKQSLQISYAVKNNDGKDLVPSLFVIESGIEPIKYIAQVQESHLIEMNKPVVEFHPAADREIIAARLENFKLSVSSMNKWLKCQIAFYFENILRVPFIPTDALIFGNATHRSLKKAYDHYKVTGQILPLEQFLWTFEQDMIRNRGNIAPDKFERKMALKPLLVEYWEKHYVPSNKVVVTEYKVKNLTINDVPWEGDFDKLEFNGMMVDIVDYKTGKYNYIKASLRPGEDTWRQLVSYKLMLDRMHWTGWKFQGARIEMIDEDYMGPIPLNITKEDEETVLLDIVTAYNGIKNMEFSKGCGEETCKWCNGLKS